MSVVKNDFNRAVREAAFVAFCRTIQNMEDDTEIITEDDWLKNMEGYIEDAIEDMIEDIFASISRDMMIREMKKHIADRFDDDTLGVSIAEDENDMLERAYYEALEADE